MSQPATGTPCPACGTPRRSGETWIYHARILHSRVLVHPRCTTKPLKNK